MPGDKTTLWMSRFTTEGGSYAGLADFDAGTLASALADGPPTVALLGGGAHHARQVIGRTPALPLARTVWVPLDDAEAQLAQAMRQLLESPTDQPHFSTGFVGKQTATCNPSRHIVCHKRCNALSAYMQGNTSVLHMTCAPT